MSLTAHHQTITRMDINSFSDPSTLQTIDLPTATYWRQLFPVLTDTPETVGSVVLDVEFSGRAKGKRSTW